MPRHDPSAYALSELARLRRVGGETLYPEFREAVLVYYRDHGISGWGGGDQPTASPISSQIACINHLELARQHHDVALALARRVQPQAGEVLAIEDGWSVQATRVKTHAVPAVQRRLAPEDLMIGVHLVRSAAMKRANSVTCEVRCEVRDRSQRPAARSVAPHSLRAQQVQRIGGDDRLAFWRPVQDEQRRAVVGASIGGMVD